MFDIYDFYEKMDDGKIMLSFKGEITSDLLTSILNILESKLDNTGDEPKLRKKVYNILVECLQNLYHHNDGLSEENGDHTALFLIGRSTDGNYRIITGNYILNENVEAVKGRIDRINSLSKDELKAFYMDTLNNEEYSGKGGGGLGMIDIARKSGQKIIYDFRELDGKFAFFSLIITITP
ncbi:MAG: SiaB family protein kinase [Bacteroidetes bacterium]|nr:SiaB family protein kinase [Bacteroidota bacterium]